jgi:hypothetical protein
MKEDHGSALEKIKNWSDSREAPEALELALSVLRRINELAKNALEQSNVMREGPPRSY